MQNSGIWFHPAVQPEGVDFFPDGSFLIGNGGTSEVQHYDSNGIFIQNLVSAGTGQRAGLLFDVEAIPDYATIVDAKLRLTVLEENSEFGSFMDDSLKVLMFDSTWSIDPRLYQTAVSKENVIANGQFETKTEQINSFDRAMDMKVSLDEEQSESRANPEH